MSGQFSFAPGVTVPIDFEISRLGSGGVGSLTVTYQIRNAATGNSYYDFADNTFKTSGWTTKQQTLTAVSGETGRYRATWNTALAAAVVDGFNAVIEIIIGGTEALIESYTYSFATFAGGGGASVAQIWNEPIAGHLTAGTTGKALFDASQASASIFGDGSVSVGTDYGGVDNLRAVDGGGAGIDNVIIRAFLTADYAAGNTADSFLHAKTRTKADGRLQDPMALDPGAYTLLYEKQGAFGPNPKTLTVT